MGSFWPQEWDILLFASGSILFYIKTWNLGIWLIEYQIVIQNIKKVKNLKKSSFGHIDNFFGNKAIPNHLEK